MEEAATKLPVLWRSIDDPVVVFHMIGHVQSRKADLVAQYFTFVHSLDSLKLATRLDRFCGQKGKKMPVLLEFNLGGEESKTGFEAWDEQKWDNLISPVEGIVSCQNLVVRGLMTMPPLFEDPEKARPYFVRLRQLRDFLAGRFPQSDWAELSMGTSADYPIAVQESATLVRIGTAILGPRVI